MLRRRVHHPRAIDDQLIVSDEIASTGAGSNATETLTWQMHVSTEHQPVVTAGGATMTGGSPSITVHLAVANTTLPNGTDTCPGAVLTLEHPQVAPPQYSLQGWAKLVVTAPVRWARLGSFMDCTHPQAGALCCFV